MTVADELQHSDKFWLKRIEQQAEYIAKFDNYNRTRPDKSSVLESAVEILERCQLNYLKYKK